MFSLKPSSVKKSLVALAFGLSLLPAAALADMATLQPRAVVELFTSQGCSSCPPADEILTELSASSDVLALAYHVDYWDYIGWKDTFAMAEFSDYQRAYAQWWKKDRIYTPQMVVNGQMGIVGSRRSEVDAAVSAAQLPVNMHLQQQDLGLNVVIDAQEGMPDATLWLVTFASEAEVVIERGENRGKSIVYSQIVTERRAIGMWTAQDGAVLRLPINDLITEGSDGIALILQEDVQGLPGAILAAGSLTL